MYEEHLKKAKGGGATKRASSTIYNIPSTYTGENLGILIQILTVIILVINFNNMFTTRWMELNLHLANKEEVYELTLRSAIVCRN